VGDRSSGAVKTQAAWGMERPPGSSGAGLEQETGGCIGAGMRVPAGVANIPAWAMAAFPMHCQMNPSLPCLEPDQP
jgi:hypothetical protein